ncbi:MAG: hypothetical protein RL701_3409 [Pseudomonadota bacterium]
MRFQLTLRLVLALCALASVGCRDYKHDADYCEACVTDAGAVIGLPASGDGVAAAAGLSTAGPGAGQAAVSGGVGVGTAGVGELGGRSGQAAAGSIDTKVDASTEQAGKDAVVTPEVDSGVDAGGNSKPEAGNGAGSGATTGGAGSGAAGMSGAAGTLGTAGKPVVEPSPCGSTCPNDKPVCGPLNACVECTSGNDAKCSGDTPVCEPFEFTCVGCSRAVPGSCSDRNKPICDDATNTCVACTAAEAVLCQTKNPAQVCLEQGTKHECVDCLDDMQCRDAKMPRCAQQNHQCAGCASDGDCARFSDTPRCDASSKECVRCTGIGAGQCGNGEMCVDHACVRTPTMNPNPGAEFCAPCTAAGGCVAGAGECSATGVCLPRAGDLECDATSLFSTRVANATGQLSLCGPALTAGVPTCAAIAKIGDPCNNRAECGGIAGSAECWPGPIPKCTYACSDAKQCPGNGPCVALQDCNGGVGCKYCQVY